ncbi:MAG: type I-B CRISPR-associated protein Cas7/Cst2/DevR [Candidatus Cloacimonetes bacterium]|nr:type I-B CRISPR-associated protein Cas7/Cst2/DevR [Candidatus Cloacimonadota bacterium]
MKGIELVWLSQTDLTNLNSGEGGTNLVDVKKYLKNGIDYPYVSGQAMRFYLREAVRRDLPEKNFMCTPNDKGENCGDEEKCMNCDLFGYMLPKKGEGAGVRVSPVKVSPAMGLLPLEDNSTIDFLTRKKHKAVGEKTEGDIVNVELGINIYKCGVSIDIRRVGTNEELDEKSKVLNLNSFINDDERKQRIISVLEGIQFISDYSKQSRLLTDFTPDIILGASQTRYSHRLQKAFEIDAEKNLNLERFAAVIEDMKDYCDIYFGLLPGILTNETKIKSKAKELDLEILTPSDVIKKLVQKLEENNDNQQ